ncbi:hypothetical protein AYI70_g6277 [Smittium culicis]|uniref:Protein transport protein SFT2 n=1 Tax=Smittium culicis TaxID=133412 RepID=A0A1R1XQN6_9FUNG|nr:hypothetical protein AYI70_g6277 [Smittium culicis]
MSLPFHVSSNNIGQGLPTDPFNNDPGMFGLSRTERYYAFGASMLGGFVLMLLASIMLFSARLTSFAVMYTVGNLLCIFSKQYA